VQVIPKIRVQERTTMFKFYHPLTVRYAETDAQGHVFFGNYFTYFDVALTEYLGNLDFTYADMLASGVDMYYVDARCQYQGRAFFEDLLHVHTRIARFGNTSFSFEFAVVRMGSNEVLATGEIAAVTVDLQTGEPIRVPDALRRAVAEFEGHD
jgi:acyl-CoA thioester hydrolase